MLEWSRGAAAGVVVLSLLGARARASARARSLLARPLCLRCDMTSRRTASKMQSWCAPSAAWRTHPSRDKHPHDLQVHHDHCVPSSGVGPAPADTPMPRSSHFDLQRNKITRFAIDTVRGSCKLSMCVAFRKIFGASCVVRRASCVVRSLLSTHLLQSVTHTQISHASIRRGISLIEMLVVLAVIAVLLGIAMPLLGRSRKAAQGAQTLAAMGQDAALVLSYAAEQRMFPLADPDPFVASYRWEHALTASGHLATPGSSDPVAQRRYGGSLISMSVCMVYDPAKMTPGYTVPVELARSSPVGDHQIAFPSDKGMLIRLTSEAGPDRTSGSFCCTDFVKVPIAMADGSTLVADRTQFHGGETPVVIDQIGVPVFSTWGGYLARDRK